MLRYLTAHGAAEPDDLLGETFVQVVRGLGTFEGGEEQFRAWVFAIARHRLLDAWRYSTRRPLKYVEPELIKDIGRSESAEDRVMSNHADEQVSAVLGTLSTDQRDVIFLRIISGLSVKEVAGILGKRPGAVKSLQVRGLAAIRRAISRKAVS